MLILEKIFVAAESGHNALQMRHSTPHTPRKAKQVNTSREFAGAILNLVQILRTPSR
jgi:hypothetical protein